MKKHGITTLLKHLTVIFGTFIVNFGCSCLLYMLIINIFSIETTGKMNYYNGLAVVLASWFFVCLLAFVLALVFRKRLHGYLATVLIADVIFFFMPVLYDLLFQH